MEMFRKKGNERKEQNGFKRPATTSINKYEVHTLKKIPSLCTKKTQQKDCEIINEFPVEVKIEDNSE